MKRRTAFKSLGKVLVLNADFTPATIISVERALVLIYQQKVVLVSHNDAKTVHSAYTDFLFPSIVRLMDYVKLPYKKVPLTKRNIFRRDNFECAYCLADEHLTVDHIIPKSRGGEDTWTNLISACRKCNNTKNDMTPEEAGMKLLKKPSRPNHIMLLKSLSRESKRDWEPYLFA